MLAFADPVVMAGVPHPIPSRTRPLSPLALMVLRLKARESKSLPGQQKLAKQNRHLPEQTCQLAGETNEARLCRAFFVPEIQTLMKNRICAAVQAPHPDLLGLWLCL